MGLFRSGLQEVSQVFKKIQAKSWPILEIDDLNRLSALESVILERIRNTPKGGILFMKNPFKLLDEVGVHLSDQVIAFLKTSEPRLNHLDDVGYEQIKHQRMVTEVRVKFRHLFKIIA